MVKFKIKMKKKMNIVGQKNCFIKNLCYVDRTYVVL